MSRSWLSALLLLATIATCVSTGPAPMADSQSAPPENVRAYLASHPPRWLEALPDVDFVYEGSTPNAVFGTVQRFAATIESIPVLGMTILPAASPRGAIEVHESEMPATLTLIPRSAGASPLSLAAVRAAATKQLTEGTPERVEEPQPYWLPTPNGFQRIFRVVVTTAGPRHRWEVLLDAFTGNRIRIRDLIVTSTN